MAATRRIATSSRLSGVRHHFPTAAAIARPDRAAGVFGRRRNQAKTRSDTTATVAGSDQRCDRTRMPRSEKSIPSKSSRNSVQRTLNTVIASVSCCAAGRRRNENGRELLTGGRLHRGRLISFSGPARARRRGPRTTRSRRRGRQPSDSRSRSGRTRPARVHRRRCRARTGRRPDGAAAR